MEHLHLLCHKAQIKIREDIFSVDQLAVKPVGKHRNLKRLRGHKCVGWN